MKEKPMEDLFKMSLPKLLDNIDKMGKRVLNAHRNYLEYQAKLAINGCSKIGLDISVGVGLYRDKIHATNRYNLAIHRITELRKEAINKARKRK